MSRDNRFWQDNPDMEIAFEGCCVRFSNDPIRPGDLYLAERNTGVKLLTCREHDTRKGIVFPREPEYPFDSWECRKVTHVDGEAVD